MSDDIRCMSREGQRVCLMDGSGKATIAAVYPCEGDGVDLVTDDGARLYLSDANFSREYRPDEAEAKQNDE